MMLIRASNAFAIRSASARTAKNLGENVEATAIWWYLSGILENSTEAFRREGPSSH